MTTNTFALKLSIHLINCIVNSYKRNEYIKKGMHFIQYFCWKSKDIQVNSSRLLT